MDTFATQVTGWLFVAGVIIFSGSLYILSITGIRWLGAVTPVGGLCLSRGTAPLQGDPQPGPPGSVQGAEGQRGAIGGGGAPVLAETLIDGRQQGIEGRIVRRLG